MKINGIRINNLSKKDFVIIVLIVFLPFAFYLYDIAPTDDKLWATKWFTIDSGFYDDVNFYFWYIFVKLLTICILSIWYLTCKYWWRYVLLISLIVEIFKFVVVYRTAIYGFDYLPYFTESFKYSIPFIVVLEFLSRYLGYNKKVRRYSIEVNEEINNQIVKLADFNFKNYKYVNKELKILEQQKNVIGKTEYLTKLIELRDRLTI